PFKRLRFKSSASRRWLLEGLGCWDARKLGGLEVFNLTGSNAFKLSSLKASWPPSKKLTFELLNPEPWKRSYG
ncbi:MAG: hypothetical protein PVF62_16850, partial [Desulfobacterales bacterium]